MISAIRKQDFSDSKTGFQRLINLCNHILISVIIALLVLVAHGTGICQNTSSKAQAEQSALDNQTQTSHTVINSLTATERVWLREHPIIRVVQNPAWPPIEFADEQGKSAGIADDYLKIIEERLGLRFERISGLTLQEAYARLQRWEIDMTTSIAETAQRKKFWSFTKPYITIPIVIVTHTDVTYISDMRELVGKKIAVVDIHVANEFIQRDFPAIQLVRVGNTEEGLKLLQKGKVFAYIDNMLVVGYYLAKLKMTNLKVAGETPYSNAQSMAVRKDWEPLAGILQRALDSISETERSEIYHKWLPIRYEHVFDYTLLWYALAIFALILSGFIAWNWKLSREIRSRKEAERALVNSEDKFRVVFESANVGKSITLPTGEIDVNQALCDMLGYTKEELKGKKWQDITPLDELETTQKPLDQLLQGKKDSVRFNKGYIHKNGSYIWADVSAVVHRDFDGKPLFLITTIIDITERKNAQEKVRLAYEHLRRFIDSNIIGVVIATADGKIIETNDYYLNIIGFTRKEFETGKVDWRAITPPEWLLADENGLRELREKGTCTPYEKEYQLRDGTRISVLLTDALLPGPDEQIAAFVLDITERKRAENALRESERKLREVQEMAHLGSWYWDVKTGDVKWSEEVYKIFCLDPKEFKPHIDSILALSPWPEDHQRDQELINRAIETHSPGFYEQKFLRPDKSIGYYYSTFQGNYNTHGELVSIVGTVMDITERKRAEDEIRTLNEDLEQKINERTAELRETIAQLEETNRSFVGRELKMIELKERIAELEKEVKEDS